MKNIEYYLNKIHQGNSFALIEDMPLECIDLVITSPPYFQQRVYSDSENEIGRETEIDAYLLKLIEMVKLCIKVLKPNGSLVINIGDKYIKSNLMLIPWQFASLIHNKTKLTLINQMTWVKTNPTPRQFDRRMVSSSEPFFHWVKSTSYKYYPERLQEMQNRKANSETKIGQGYFELIDKSTLTEEQKILAYEELTTVIEEVKAGTIASLRMKIRDVHSLPFGGQEGGRKTQIEKKGFTIIRVPGKSMLRDVFSCPVENIRDMQHRAIYPKEIIDGFIDLTTDKDDIVFDPFIGSGTTAVSAKELERRYIGFELNPKFVDEARKRVGENNGS